MMLMIENKDKITKKNHIIIYDQMKEEYSINLLNFLNNFTIHLLLF
jgi:endo-beta-N-acetylglucosaminidase D